IDRFMNITDKYGKSGNMKGELNDPRDICTDDSGNIYITNYGNDRVDIFDSDFIYRGFIGSRGKEPGNFRGPVGITVDSMQNIYVCDFYNGRVQKFTTDGNLVGLIGTGELKHPNFVTVDNSGKVYVSDVGSADVKVYSPEMFTEGKKALLDKDYEKAEKLLEYAVNIDSSNYNAYYYLGYTYYKLRKYGELLGITASLSEKDVDNRAYELLEVLCREVKKWRLGY
ncbi:MAG: NHL repeat-containing protein, partial [Candidatus Muiribacteriaceae bacterium]